jgi:hypothetical protein
MSTFRTYLHSACLIALLATHAGVVHPDPIPGIRRAVERLSDAQFGSLPVSELGIVS